jgi:hypothetical protein
MVKSVEEVVRNFVEGVRGAGPKWERKTLLGEANFRRWMSVFLPAHAGAAYIPSPETESDKIRNVQLAWRTTKSVKAQYHGRGVAGVAGAIPLAPLPPA